MTLLHHVDPDRAQDHDSQGNLLGVGEQFAEFGTRLTGPIETEDRRSCGECCLVRRHPRETLSLSNRVGKLRAAELRQVRFVIEQIELRGCAILEKINNAFGPRRKMRSPVIIAFSPPLLNRSGIMSEPSATLPIPRLSLDKNRRLFIFNPLSSSSFSILRF